MRIAKLITTVTLTAAIIIGGAGVSNMDVSAGSSDIVVSSTSFANNIDVAVWSVPSEDIIAENGKIIFPKESTADSRIITKLAIANSAQNEELFSADIHLKLKELPAEQAFIVGFSLSSIEAYNGEAGNVELLFENNNGVKASLIAYDDSGEKQVLSEAKSCGVSIGSNVNISAQASIDNKLTLKVNGTTLYNAVSPIALEGRIGFLQTGSCEAEVTSVDIISHKYDTPENANITEDFEGDGINKNAVHSKMYGQTGVQATLGIEEYNGSKVLMFRNVGNGYFGTNYQYSNFELTFDVPYMQLDIVTNEEDGALITMRNSGIAVSMGDASTEYSSLGYADASEAIIFTGTTVKSQLTGAEADISGKNFYQKGSVGSYSVKIKVVDQKVSVAMKALEKEDYVEVLSYSLGNETPLGYVHVWSTGTGYFAIDNFNIANKDEEGQITDVEYQSATVTGVEDWEYQPMEKNYLEQEAAQHEFNWMWLVLYAGIAGAIIIGVCFGITRVRKTAPKKGVSENEE